uniref:Uncharacterized protein n=1 Tax=Amphimedon queenslandica TaxID=400682 RepID=A0A1X7TPN3_AMPQE
MLVPIPVLISGYRDDNGVLVNKGDDSSQWQFVRRFYTHQSVTGTPSYLEYTKINIQLTSHGHIQSPYLRLSFRLYLPMMHKLHLLLDTVEEIMLLILLY